MHCGEQSNHRQAFSLPAALVPQRRRQPRVQMGPMCLINVLTDMENGRTFMAPALVAEKEGTMYGMILIKSLTFFFMKNDSLGIIAAG